MRESRRRFAAVALVCAFAGSGAAAAPKGQKAKMPEGPVHVKLLRNGKGRTVTPVRATVKDVKPGAVAGVGTLQYDNDIPASRGAGFQVVGNRFDVGFQDPHSIVAMSLRMGGAPGGAAVAGVLDVNPTAMTVQTLGIGFFNAPTSTAGSMVIVVPLTNVVATHSGPFIGGVANYPVIPTCSLLTTLGVPCNGVALSAGTMDPGMGFHAVGIDNTLSSGQPLGNRNAIFRVSGDNLPVELLGLGVE